MGFFLDTVQFRKPNKGRLSFLTRNTRFETEPGFQMQVDFTIIRLGHNPLPVAASQLRHYRGGSVVHQYYDHNTQQHKRQKLSQEEMLRRYVSHIPARHFKMVRYYGFLANRKRGSLLPKVYEALEMTPREKPQKPGFAVLMKAFLGTDPYQCILCKGRLRFAGAMAGEHATKMLSDRLYKMAKNDGFRHRLWISAPENRILDEKHIKTGIFQHYPATTPTILGNPLPEFMVRKLKKG